MAHQSYNPINNEYDKDTVSSLPRCQHGTCSNCQFGIIINELNKMLGLVNDTSVQKTCDLVDKASIETFIFYCDVILKKRPTSDLGLDHLYSHIQKASPEVKNIVKNTKDLNHFFCKYPHIFNVNDDKISLKNPAMFHENRLKWIQMIFQNDYPSINKSVINAIQFYSDILNEKKSTFPISQLINHSNKAREEVQIIATNPVELKSFLTAYSQIFVVNEDKVKLTDEAMCHKGDCRWLEELIYSDSPVKIQYLLMRKAMEYYLYSILLAEPSYEMSVDQLYNLQKRAPREIQNFTKTPEDLRIFLTHHSNIFYVKENKVKITKSLFKRLKKGKSVVSEEKSHDLICTEKNITQENKLKTELDKCLQNIQDAMKRYCLLEVPVVQLISEIDTSVIKNEHELKAFLSNFPSIFFIRDNKVILWQLYNKTTDSRLRNCTSVDEFAELILKVIDYYKIFLLKSVGVNVYFPIKELMKFKNLAPPEVQKIIIDEDDLRFIIGLSSESFIISKASILLKDIHGEENSSFLKSKLKDIFTFCLWILKEKVGIGIEFPIARLKIYMDVAPFEARINNLLELKLFLGTFPDFFIISNNTVTLRSSFYAYNVLDFEKYAKYEKLYYIENYSTSEAIAFYSRILNTFCFNLEVPVSHLFGYRSLAPVEVMALAKDPIELMKFFYTHPDIFRIHEDKVSLSKYKAGKENESGLNDSTDKIAVQFYTSILNKVCHNPKLPIVTLFGYQHLAPVEVKDFIKTPLELKAFLNKYPSYFSTDKDIVILKNTNHGNKGLPCRDQNQDKCKDVFNISVDNQLMLNSTNYISRSPDFSNVDKSEISDFTSVAAQSKKLAIINAIRFYSNIMFKKGPNTEHLIANLISFRSEATDNIKGIARRPIDLLAFLSAFPQIFSVNNVKLTVKLVDMVSFYNNQRSWIKELLPKYHQSTTNHELVVNGINFFSNIICEKSSEFNLPLKSLFSNRKTAMEDVQSLVKSVSELKNFLLMYPEIFTVAGEKVTLTNAALSQTTQPKWIEQIVSDSDFSDQDIKFNEDTQNESSNTIECGNDFSVSMGVPVSRAENVKTRKSIEFFKSILETGGQNVKFSYGKLFEYRCLAPQEVKEFIKTPSQLKDFFLRHSNIFIVENNNISSKYKQESLKNKQNKLETDRTLNSSDYNAIDKDFIKKKNKSTNSSQMSDTSTSECKIAHISDIKDSKYITINTILFYTNIMCRKGPHLQHLIVNLFGHQTKALNEVKETFKKPKDLKAFFSKFPQLFTVDHDKLTVALTDLSMLQKNQRSWIKELLPKHHHATANHEAVVSTIQFYSDIIFEKSSENDFPLNNLFSHKTGAMEDVKAMTKNMTDLESFLSTFPEIFILRNNRVSLTNLAISHKSQPKWIEQLVGSGCEISHEVSTTVVKNSVQESGKMNSEELLKQKKLAVHKALQFYYKIMLNNVSNKGFSLGELLDHLNEAPSCVKEITENITQLNDFLLKYPHIFTINEGVVFLTSFCN